MYDKLWLYNTIKKSQSNPKGFTKPLQRKCNFTAKILQSYIKGTAKRAQHNAEVKPLQSHRKCIDSSTLAIKVSKESKILGFYNSITLISLFYLFFPIFLLIYFSKFRELRSCIYYLITLTFGDPPPSPLLST